MGSGLDIYHAKLLHSDLSTGVPKFEDPFSRYDLPRLVKPEFAVGRSANYTPDGIFAHVMSNARDWIE